MKTLDFYFDIYSPYAYLGFHRLMQISAGSDCAINYHPVDLPRLKIAAGNTGPANLEIPPKIKYLLEDLKRWAQRYELPFGDIPKAKDYSRINQGAFYALDQGRELDYIRAAYNLVWGRGGSADSDAELAGLASTMEWDTDRFLSFIGSDKARDRFEQSNLAAIERGVFGVPTIICEGHMWWGNDRMDFVEQYLK